VALRHYREEGFCSAKTLAFGGETLSGFLAGGLLPGGVLRLPMLVVYTSACSAPGFSTWLSPWWPWSPPSS